MIDKDTFLAGMTALSGAFGREIDGAVQRMYYGILSPKITTDEFQQAIKDALESETFWPAPAVLLGKVARLKEDVGALAFAHVNKITGEHGGFRYLSWDTYQSEFDAPTKAAIASVGGLAKIANTTEDQWPGLAKRFAAAHQTARVPPAIERHDAKALQSGERD
jgi:hypothetical protein